MNIENADQFVAAVEAEFKSDFTVGQKVQFYRKDVGDNQFAIVGHIMAINRKNGWLTVDHRWGTATVKPDEEKCSVLREKAQKDVDDDNIVGKGRMTGKGPNPQNLKKSSSVRLLDQQEKV